MSEAAQIARSIERQIASLPCGSLAFFGDIFGGRIDNIHRFVAAHVEDSNSLVIDFDGAETLRVWDPESAEISPTTFLIQRASRVRWEWFSYGRPLTPENLRVIESAWVGGRLTVVEDGAPLRHDLRPSAERPAVEMLWYS